MTQYWAASFRPTRTQSPLAFQESELEDLKIIGPLPLYSLTRTSKRVRNHCPLAFSGWRYLFKKGSSYVRTGDLAGIEGEPPRFAGFVDGNMQSLSDAFLAAEHLAEMMKRTYWLRIGVIPKLRVNLVWMKPRRGLGVFIPIGPTLPKFPANVPFSVDQVLRIVKSEQAQSKKNGPLESNLPEQSELL